MPAISRLDPGESRAEKSATRPGQNTAASGMDGDSRSSWLKPFAKSIWVAIPMGVGAGFLGGHLAIAWQPTVFSSEEPSVTIHISVAGDDIDGDARQLRDALMVALSQFQTQEVLQPAGDDGMSVDTQLRTSSTAASAPARPEVALGSLKKIKNDQRWSIRIRMKGEGG